MKTHPKFISKTSGFSLIEMLVVIAVIGILGAIGVNEIADINGAGKNAKAMRNAQNLASIFQSAKTAGVDFYDTTLEDTIANVVNGQTVNNPGNPFHGTHFGLPEMSPEEQTWAGVYLTLDTATEAILYDVNVIPPTP